MEITEKVYQTLNKKGEARNVALKAFDRVWNAEGR